LVNQSTKKLWLITQFALSFVHLQNIISDVKIEDKEQKTNKCLIYLFYFFILKRWTNSWEKTI